MTPGRVTPPVAAVDAILSAWNMCIACDLAQGRRPLPGGSIYRVGGWLVEHCIGRLGLGTLIVKPERHVTAVAGLTEDEAAQVGPLRWRASKVAGQLVEADQVHNCLWSHAGGLPVHIHYVIQPVTRQQMTQHGLHGPNLQVAMFAARELPDPRRVELISEKARRLFADA